MKKIVIGETGYELKENYNDGFDESLLMEIWTEDFEKYDYVVGDFSYNKLRIKGFYEKNNKKSKEHNNFKNLKIYLDENCAYGCKYFIIKKTK